MALNRFLTIAWQLAGVPEDRITQATSKFLKLASDSLRCRKARFAYVYVHERGARLGLHVHLLLHVNSAHAKWFAKRQRGWIRQCGGTSRKGVIKTVAVGGNYRLPYGDEMSRQRYDKNLANVLDYLLKDATPTAKRRFGIQNNGVQGRVTGRRAGLSRCISTGACA